ncbi:unnamed protein product [Larinioides sclopetarius]|uniref:Uncharacterized protein n=1 Tax=Larinioides sclopetarius TaxID=280406 RepID=A0AAV2BRZ4_9ARAC
MNLAVKKTLKSIVLVKSVMKLLNNLKLFKRVFGIICMNWMKINKWFYIYDQQLGMNISKNLNCK